MTLRMTQVSDRSLSRQVSSQGRHGQRDYTGISSFKTGINSDFHTHDTETPAVRSLSHLFIYLCVSVQGASCFVLR